MEAKFKRGDVVVQDDINVPMVKMTIEIIFKSISNLDTNEYQCAFFELGDLIRERFREDEILFDYEFVQKRRNSYGNKSILKANS